MRKHHKTFRTFLRKREVEPEQFYDQLRLWLRATLADDQRRAEFETMLQQFALPVIQLGKAPKGTLRTTTRPASFVNSAKT